MKNVLFCLIALLMVSCETLTGDLTVSSALTFEDGTTVAPGSYKASIKARKRSLKLKLPNGDKIKFKIPKNSTLPSRNGNISLSQSDVKQPYDVEGKVNTTTTESESRRDYERCTYRESYQICRDDSQGRRTCYTQHRDVNGYRNVQYRLRTDNKYLSVSLLSPGTNLVNAQFEGLDVTRMRIYEYTGICR